MHNKKALILNESSESYIIANTQSYDYRQYPEWMDPKWTGSHYTPAGQGFGHCLVIPKKRIFNIVDPDAVAKDCSVIEELRNHFLAFWQKPENRDSLEARTKEVFDQQNQKLKDKDGERAARIISDVTDDYNKMAGGFTRLETDNFTYGFHPFPQMSVGHLHLHVFPNEPLLRTYSSRQHDEKTIPFQDVIDVERDCPFKPDNQQQT